MNRKKNLFLYLFFALFSIFIIFPLLALFLHISPEAFLKTFSDENYWSSLKNTLLAAGLSSLLTLLFVFSLGYFRLYKSEHPLFKIILFFQNLPTVLPHTVAGLALLLAFGHHSFFDKQMFNLTFAFTFSAVILAMFFVSFPLASQPVLAALERISPEEIHIAETLGLSSIQIYTKIIIPQIKTVFFSGLLLSFARAISEFAAVALFGGNVSGTTQVLASYVFSKIEEGEIQVATTAGASCLAMSLLLTILIQYKKKSYVTY